MSVQGAERSDAPLFDDAARSYDALLVFSFGGPEGMEDVVPFLQNVAEGRNIPAERLQEVAGHYADFGGVSPINGQNRALIAALEAELAAHGPQLPIYFGNRNWHPFIADTLRQMCDDGVRRALLLVTSAYSSYSGCRQYREDILRAAAALGPDALTFDKLRVFYNHPGFIEPMVERTREALAQFPDAGRASPVAGAGRDGVHLIFTAHSIPTGMARNSDYVAQLEESCRLVAHALGRSDYALVYQSRSGPPQVPWLEPDILDYLTQIRAQGVENAVMVPIGFISDHMEVLFDLDYEAQQRAAALGMKLVRAATVGTDPAFVAMLRELIVERMSANPTRRALGTRGPNHDICPLDCCLKGESGRPPAH